MPFRCQGFFVFCAFPFGEELVIWMYRYHNLIYQDMAVSSVNNSNFDEVVLQATKPIVVLFWAPFAKASYPLQEQLADLSEKTNDILYAQLNVDDSVSTAEKYFVQDLPTILFFKNGAPVGSQIGAIATDVLIRLENQVFSE